MLSPTQLERYADILIWGLTVSRKKPFANADVVLVRFDLPSLPLMEMVYTRLLDLHLNPVVRMNPTYGMERDFYDKSAYKQLDFVAPGERELMGELCGLISLLAPQSLTHLAHIDPERFGVVMRSRKFLRDIMERREEGGDFGWTLCLYPTEALAASAGISPEAYAEQIAKACWLNDAEPTKQWRRIWREAGEIKSWLSSLDVVSYHVESDDVDLTVTPGEKRRWVGITGHNIPSFELYTSPDWRGTSGRYYADQPSYRSGNLIKGVQLTFERGQAVRIEAEQGEEFAVRQIGMDIGAGRVGEFSLTDKRFSRIDRFMAHTLYDENYGGEHGNCHIAVGSSYSDTYAGDASELDLARKEELGFNNSALHWDLVNTQQKRVTARLADGRSTTIYENGVFAY